MTPADKWNNVFKRIHNRIKELDFYGDFTYCYVDYIRILNKYVLCVRCSFDGTVVIESKDKNNTITTYFEGSLTETAIEDKIYSELCRVIFALSMK